MVTPVPVGLSLSPSCVLQDNLLPRVTPGPLGLSLPFGLIPPGGQWGVLPPDPQTKGLHPVPGRVGTAGVSGLPCCHQGLPGSAGLWGDPQDPPVQPLPALGWVSGWLWGVRAAGAALAALGGWWQR